MLDQAAPQALPLALLTTLLMTLMGPIALIPRFAASTGGEGLLRTTQIALIATATSAAVVLLAVGSGADKLAQFGISKPALILAAGLILTTTSLMTILGIGSPGGPGTEAPGPTPLRAGLSPIAIPGIMSPVSVCILLIFVSYFPSGENKIKIIQAAFGVLFVDFLAMLIAGWFMRRVGAFPLVLLGAAFGVLQLALGVEMLISGVSKAFSLR